MTGNPTDNPQIEIVNINLAPSGVKETLTEAVLHLIAAATTAKLEADGAEDSWSPAYSYARGQQHALENAAEYFGEIIKRLI